MKHLLCWILCSALWVRSVSAGALGGRRRRADKGPYPLYMMHLYRTLLAGDGKKLAGTSSVGIGYEHPSLHDSDSVLSLVAKSEYSTLMYILGFFTRVTLDQRIRLIIQAGFGITALRLNYRLILFWLNLKKY